MRLEEYISTFREEMRDVVVDQIVKNRIIKQAIETPQGKALLNSVVDAIRDKVVKIVSLASETWSQQSENDMRHAASQVHIMFNLMKDWAQILIDGEHHEETMNKEQFSN